MSSCVEMAIMAQFFKLKEDKIKRKQKYMDDLKENIHILKDNYLFSEKDN